jgi:hypothetical protein
MLIIPDGKMASRSENLAVSCRTVAAYLPVYSVIRWFGVVVGRSGGTSGRGLGGGISTTPIAGGMPGRGRYG